MYQSAADIEGNDGQRPRLWREGTHTRHFWLTLNQQAKHCILSDHLYVVKCLTLTPVEKNITPSVTKNCLGQRYEPI